ncbi:MAG: cytochrome c oxidase assembly protein [Acidobacteriaceae bacterium]
MSDALSQAILQSWNIPLVPTVGAIVLAILYVRGWRLAYATRERELPPWRMLCFLSGILLAWLSIASPLDALGQFLLFAHMTQHVLLMTIAPILIVLGAPTVPILRGLPRTFVKNDLAPWMNSKAFHSLQDLFTHPAFVWIITNASFILWHTPPAYELALRNNTWHDVEHACFFFTFLAFWWIVLQPWPSRSRWPRWFIIPFLASAEVVNTGVSLFLVFYGSVIYPTYAQVPRIFGISPLTDQTAAGAEMWVMGGMAFWIPLMFLTLQMLSPGRSRRFAFAYEHTHARIRRPTPKSFDLLQTPILGPMLRSRFGRAGLQSLTLLLIAALILDGLHGTPITGLNLAGSVLWNLLRPINLLLFFLAGNLFCLACPFTLPRELARFFGLGKLNFPRWLKNKWPAILLLLLFFWAYEHFSLWNSPRYTAWVLLAYIAAVFVIDSIFRGANFCKYVCPIGQFNFFASLLSPLDLGVKSQKVCSTCSTRDCIRGNEQQRGCELQLYLPTKVGNMDCTLCMDCVKACPTDNIAITLQSPLRDITRNPIRSSLRKFSNRFDVAVLVLLLSVGAIFNAGVMIAPVVDRLEALEAAHSFLATNTGTLLMAAAVFVTLLALCAAIAKLLQIFSTESRLRTVFCRFAFAMVPLGLAMWAAHLTFHLVTATSTFLPSVQHAWHALAGSAHHHAAAMQSMANMPGMNMSNMAGMSMPPISSAAPMNMISKPSQLNLIPGAKGINLFSLQIWMLDLGLLLTLYAGWRLVKQMSANVRNAAAMLSIWALSSTAFYAICLWIYTQPMEMRGMGM